MENMLILAGWGLLVCALILTTLGVTNRIVIFQDWADFFFSCGPVYLAVATFVVFETLNVPLTNGPLNSFDDIEKIIFHDLSTMIVTLVAVVAILICALASLKAAFSANGLFLGLIVFLFKFASSVLLSFLVIAKFKDLIDEKSTFATRFAAMVLLGLFSWLINALVNGERVEQRKIEERGELQ